MRNAIVSVPTPRNEPILAYAPGSPERKTLRAQLAKMSSEVVEITPVIGGRPVATRRTAGAAMPHDHRPLLAGRPKAGAPRGPPANGGARGGDPQRTPMGWAGRAGVLLP